VPTIDDVVDLADEGRRQYLPWHQGMSRAIGFEFAGALTAQCGTPDGLDEVRAQHKTNGMLLLKVLYPGRNWAMIPEEVLFAMETVVHWAITQIGPAHLVRSPANAVRERYLLLLISAGDLLPALGVDKTLDIGRG
jgi:hypothetical protein